MHFLYAADENYVRHAAASMVSLLEHAKEPAGVTLHLMSMGIKPESEEALRAIAARFHAALVIHEMGNIREWFSFSFNPRGFAASAMARLLVGRVVDESVRRILYLDCDTVVLDDLSGLEQLDMGGCAIGMVREATVNKGRRAELNLPDAVPYFNSGILLIDLERWRAERTEDTILDFYRGRNGDLVAPDQDAINGALPGRIFELPARYNYGSIQIYYSWKAQKRISTPTPYPSREDYARQTEQPAIVHFLGEERPWRAGNRHPYTPEYDRCLSETPWKSTPKDEGWRTYFRCFYLFNFFMKPFPYLRWRVIDGLIPVFMKRREKQLKKAKA